MIKTHIYPFSPEDWKPVKAKYDFSWIGECVSGWPEDLRTPENVKNMLPSNIFWWIDFPGGFIKTHLGEPIENIEEYFRLREEWIDKNIKGL